MSTGTVFSELGAVQKLLYYMAGGEEKLLQKNLLAPYEIIAKKYNCPVTFFLNKCICPVFMNNRCCIVLQYHSSTTDEQQMLYRSSPYDSWLMTDESFLQETWKILCHLDTSLYTFLNLYDSQFCPQGEPFYV